MAPIAKPHPLSSITAEEIVAATAACKAHAESLGLERVIYNTISVKEPAKKELLAWQNAGCPDDLKPPRQAFCILITPGTVEAVVSLVDSPAKVVDWKEVPGMHPLLTVDDCHEAERICKADPGVQKLVSETYGITDMEQLVADPWSVHCCPFKEQRVVQLWLYKRSRPLDNHYAHPLSLTPIVDLNSGEVIHIDKPFGDDPKAYPPVPEKDINYCEELCEGEYRKDLKDLNIVQPEGASWTITGEEIVWQKWHIRVSFNYREGLVLHNVGYEDKGTVRPILHRASLVEMAVPYGDPVDPYHRKCAFDVGDYGLGNCANNLKLGCDCLGNIHYFPAWLNNNKGEPVKLDHAVCMHEEDYGLSWKHVEWQTGKAWSRRLRRLVISFICTVVNYEYCFYWYFYTDGNIGYEIKATGELSTTQPSEGEDPAKPDYGTLVAEGVNAPWHQHMFSMRIDPAIDDPEGGKEVVVSEVEAVAVPRGPSNPYGSAFTVKETELLYEKEAQRLADGNKGRVWKFKNPNSLHPSTGKPVAYTLLPLSCPVLLSAPGSEVDCKAQFATKHLWVTAYDDAERFPAGDYPLQHPGGEGLPKWVAKNRYLKGADPVVWYTFGLTHYPRPEDFPTMPVDVVSFLMKPSGFFEFNPALDMPPGPNKASTLANGKSCCHVH